MSYRPRRGVLYRPVVVMSFNYASARLSNSPDDVSANGAGCFVVVMGGTVSGPQSEVPLLRARWERLSPVT
jgi:hypothetical protein